MATRNGRKFRGYDAEEKGGGSAYNALFSALFCNSATIEGITNRDGGLTDDYILQILYDYGRVAFHKPTEMWLPCEEIGTANSYGYTKEYRLFSAFGGAFIPLTVAREDLYLFDANAVQFPVSGFVRRKCKFIEHIDRAILQNLDAVKEMGIVVTNSKELAKKLTEADKARREGKSVAVLQKALTDGSVAKFDALRTNARYLVGDLQEARRKEWEDLLHIVGVSTPLEKGERMYTEEVRAQMAEASAYIGLMIDTFNRQAEEQGAPFRMVKRVRVENQKEESKNNEI